MEFINGRDILYWETSAKSGKNVAEMFKFVANRLCDSLRARGDKTIMIKDALKLITSNDENWSVSDDYGCYC